MLQRLTHYPLFEELSPADLEIIAPLFTLRTYPAGTAMISQGEPANCLFLLTQGRLELRYKPYDGAVIKLTSLSSGSVFGWSAVLGNPVYSSSAISLEECEVLVICGTDLHDLRQAHPRIGNLIIERLALSVSARRSEGQDQVTSMIHKGMNEKSSAMRKVQQDGQNAERSE